MNGGKFVSYTGPAPDSRQALNDTSMELIKAIREDTDPNADKVGDFVSKHTDWVAA